MQRQFRLIAAAVVLCSTFTALMVLPFFSEGKTAAAQGQPTVTATIGGLTVTVKSDEPQYNVRSGPSTTDYPIIGVVLPGQDVLIKGRSPGGAWVEIDFPGVPGNVGWMATIYLNIPAGLTIPITEPPPTPAPQYTATIDPTLAAEFIVTPIPTRLPTFTPPPPLVISTFLPEPSAKSPGGIPMGMVIVTLAALGVFLGLVSLIRGR